MSKKILIIEDDATALAIIKDALEKEGYEILSAETGKEGLSKAKSGEPDIVIVDTVLPDIDGFEVTREIRKSSGPVSPKIIVMTGTVDAVDPLKARDAGADEYAVKTSDLSPLLSAVKKLI